MKRDNKSLTPVDWLAMGVFVVGAFGTVLMGLSAFSDDVSTKGGTAKIATEWIAAAGLAPSLLFNAAVAFLGARTFLRGQMRGLGRDLLGSLAVAAGVSIALGVWTSETSTPGGALGAATGGLLKTRAGTALAAIVGAVAIIVPAARLGTQADSGCGTGSHGCDACGNQRSVRYDDRGCARTGRRQAAARDDRWHGEESCADPVP